MSEHRPEWYERMKTGPFRERTFTEEHMKGIGRIARGSGSSKRGSGWMYAASGLAVVCAIVLALVLRPVGWFGTDSAAPPLPTETEETSPQRTETVNPTETPQPIDGVYYVKGETGAYVEPNYFTMEGPKFTIKTGVPLKAISSSGGFVQVEQEGQTGWVNEWYLTTDKDELTVVAVEPYLMLAEKQAATHTNPQEAAPSGLELSPGKVVRVKKEYLDWVCIDIATYDQPYGGEFWLRKNELGGWNPALAMEGIIREGAVARDEVGHLIDSPEFRGSVHVEKEMSDGRYRFGAAGGLTGYVEARDFVPNPFLARSESLRTLLSSVTVRWLLTSEEMKSYETFAASRDEELLRGLSPADIFRYYVQAEENGDYETVYALLIQDPDHGVPDHETYMNELPTDPKVLERMWQRWAQLKLSYRLSEEVEQVEKDHALIRITPMDGGTSEEELGFQILRNKAGIWKVAWLPMQ